MPLGTWLCIITSIVSLQISKKLAAFDGANRLQVLWHLMPRSRGPGSSPPRYAFLFQLGCLLFPTVCRRGFPRSHSVAIPALPERYTVPYTLLEAAGVLAIATAVVVLALNRYIVSGLLRQCQVTTAGKRGNSSRTRPDPHKYLAA